MGVEHHVRRGGAPQQRDLMRLAMEQLPGQVRQRGEGRHSDGQGAAAAAWPPGAGDNAIGEHRARLADCLPQVAVVLHVDDRVPVAELGVGVVRWQQPDPGRLGSGT